jgi:hypothetical protein
LSKTFRCKSLPGCATQPGHMDLICPALAKFSQLALS